MTRRLPSRSPSPWFALVLVLAALSSCTKRMPQAIPTTIVFIARTVRTMDPARPLAEAVVVRDGRVLYVGDAAQALLIGGRDAAVERWPGSTIVPGLVDAHGHLGSLGRSLALVSLEAARSEADAVERLGRAPATAFQGDWLLGRGWDQNDWTSQAFPTRASLDLRFPKVPVFLTRVDGHAAWVNGEALARAGLSAATKDPPGGRLLRDAQGQPTGVLVDNAIDLVASKIPAPSLPEQQKRLKLALEWCVRLGLTGVHDAGTALADFRVLQQWDLLGALPLRVYAMADGQGADADEFLGLGLFRGRHLELRAVKLLADGALGSRGAALWQPYRDEPANSGLLLLTKEQLAERAGAFAARGFQVAVHAIGDRANTEVLDVLVALGQGTTGRRDRVEHAQVLTEADVGRFASAGLVASFQPTHATSDLPWAAQRLGEDRVRLAYAWRSVLATGAHVAFGSDFPVEHPNPLWGLYAARTRQDREGRPEGGWAPEQRLSGQEALAGFTTGAAYAAFAEARRGMLKVGFDADFAVLDVDPLDDPPQRLLSGVVQLTVVDGVDVFRAAP